MYKIDKKIVQFAFLVLFVECSKFLFYFSNIHLNIQDS